MSLKPSLAPLSPQSLGRRDDPKAEVQNRPPHWACARSGREGRKGLASLADRGVRVWCSEVQGS